MSNPGELAGGPFVALGMTYDEQSEFFHRCDHRIDKARFEELCQIADEV